MMPDDHASHAHPPGTAGSAPNTSPGSSEPVGAPGESAQQTPPPAPVGGVDVVIPAFNPDPTQLAAAVRSALALPGCSRVVIVDDGSTPPVVAAAVPQLSDPRVEIIRQTNAGPAAARNVGLTRTSAAWVLFLDSDDEAIAEGICAAIALAKKLNAGAAVAARIELDELGRRTTKPVPPEWADRLLHARGDVFRPIVLFSTTGAVVHRRVLDANVRFDESIIYGEDRDFLHAAGGIAPIAVSSRPAVLQRVFRDGGNLRSPRKLPRWIRDHVRLLDKHAPPPSNAGAATAHAWLAEQTRWLLNAASKSRVDAESWALLTRAAQARGWPIPLKCKLRRLLKPKR